ncbi:MAG: hypothetical protein JXQ84_00745, partial [Rhodospirillaceae bacterium]|nr:hypothetical protein [Rhodospirillaceae bacterium]
MCGRADLRIGGFFMRRHDRTIAEAVPSHHVENHPFVSLNSCLPETRFMPELPEVETIRQGLLPALLNRRIASVWVGRH